MPLYAVPKPPANNGPSNKNTDSMSYSQCQFPNHFGGDITEQFEPTFVKLDKQVSLNPFTFFPYACPHASVTAGLPRPHTCTLPAPSKRVVGFKQKRVL